MSKGSLLEAIERWQFNSLSIKRRLYLLLEVQRELDRVTSNKPFRIWDDLAWMTLIDSRDMLVIHLASFVKGLYKHHLADVLLHHLRKIHRHPPRQEVEDEYDPSIDSYADAFQRLFPECESDRASPRKRHIKGLRERLETYGQALLDDRNRNRAHAFELGTSARMLDLKELEAIFDHVEGILNDLRLLVSNGTMAMETSLSVTSPRAAARLFVDRLVLGATVQSDRDQLYQRLHELHVAAPEREFNVGGEEGLQPPRVFLREGG